MAKKKPDSAIAKEMLRGLRQFTRDLRQLSPDDAKAKYNHRTVTVDVRPRAYDAEDVVKLRRSMGCSQQVFADFIGVSVSTLRNWEQDIRPVSGVAARMFDEMRINPNYWKIRLAQSVEMRDVGWSLFHSLEIPHTIPARSFGPGGAIALPQVVM